MLAYCHLNAATFPSCLAVYTTMMLPLHTCDAASTTASTTYMAINNHQHHDCHNASGTNPTGTSTAK